MLSAIITIYVVTLILFLPRFLLYTTRWTVDPSTNVTIAVLSVRPDYPFHPDVPKQIVAVLTGVLIPTATVIVTVSSVLIIVKLGVARKTRQQMTNSESQKSAGKPEDKITKMLLCICFLFIILMLPEMTGTLVNSFLPEFGPGGCYRNTFILFFRFVSVASSLNSSVNFIAYASLSAKFRTTLRKILRCFAFCRIEANTSNTGVPSTSANLMTIT